MVRRLCLGVFLLVSLIVSAGATTTAGAAEERPLNHYSIQANLDYATATLTAHQEVDYRNASADTLDTVDFNVTPAFYGGFILDAAAVDGQPVAASLEGVSLELTLPQPLGPDSTTRIALDYHLQVPRQGGRLGVGGGIIALGNWFPILSIYREGLLAEDGRTHGWDRHPYVETGDAFFSEVADYDVVLDTSVPVVVANTGTLVNREGNHWVMKAKGVRDFALVISAGFESQTAVVDGVAVEAYYLPAHGSIAPTYLRAAQETIAWLDKLVAPYPFSRMGVAEVYSTSNTAVGQEYPNLVMISSSINEQGGPIDSYLSYLVIHEVSHQWFYSMVGNDQLYAPWMDEAMVSWLSLHFFRANYPSLFTGMWDRRLTALLDMLPAAERAKPVNTGIYDYVDETYYYGVVYRKGAEFIEDVYQAMGDEAFFEALRSYVATYRDRIATPMALIDTFQSYTQANLNPLCQRYFTYDFCAGEPIRPTAELPSSSAWSGSVSASFSAPSALSEVSVYAGDRLLVTSNTPDHMAVDTRLVPNGDYILTFLLRDAEGRSAQVSRRVTIDNQPASKNGSTSLATPSAGASSGEGEGNLPSGSAEDPVSIAGLRLPFSVPQAAAVVGGGGVVIGLTWVAMQMRRPRHRRR